MAATAAVVKRAVDDAIAQMPPPPLKKIKRPPKVLDEDDYTDALSKIIARDYFPGLDESRAQDEYLAALESGNQSWIAEASQKLRAAISDRGPRRARTARDERYNDRPTTVRRHVASTATPRGYDGSETPVSVVSTQPDADEPARLDIATHSLASFQSRYTSEDNASFNDVLDTQNKKRREQHAYMWTNNQRIPSASRLAERAHKQRLIADKKSSDTDAPLHDNSSLVPMTTGAVATRSAKPDAWKVQRPDNAFMFFPDSIDEADPTRLTIQGQKECASKAGPKETVHINTRFPPLYAVTDHQSGHVPASPSLNTDVLARREADGQLYDGAETPRVNGYAYVDEDEPERQQPQVAEPSYRDLLAGQTSSASPFRFSEQTRREGLHHRLVERTASAKRAKQRIETLKSTPIAHSGYAGTPASLKTKLGGMTPAAARLLDRIGKNPAHPSTVSDRPTSKDMWTPTPRKKAVGR